MTTVTTTTPFGHVLTRAGRNIIITNSVGDVIGIAPTWQSAEDISRQIADDNDDGDNDFDREMARYADDENNRNAPDKVVSEHEDKPWRAIVNKAIDDRMNAQLEAAGIMQHALSAYQPHEREGIPDPAATPFTWEHRVILDTDGNYRIAEVTFEGNEPTGWNDPFIMSDTADGLVHILQDMVEACLEKPVLPLLFDGSFASTPSDNHG